MELHWDGGKKVCSDDPGLMTRTAAMSRYGENLKKIFLFGTNWPMLFKLGIQHRALEYYRVCSNDDSWLTFDLLMPPTSKLMGHIGLWLSVRPFKNSAC